MKIFLNKICSTLSLLIIDELEEEFLKRILKRHYFYFDEIECKQILELYFDINSNDFETYFNKKFNILFDCFFNFLSENKSIVLAGFINFRIKSDWDILDEIISKAVNEYIIEKEYMEFISLLKLYINSQSNGCESVHLIYNSSDSILLDENKEIISSFENIFKAKYLSDISFSSNDYTLNSLLTLLPKKIYIHLVNNYIDEFINTLQAVFENRIEICTNCEICNLYKETEKSK